MSRQWTETDIPDLHGRTAVVTDRIRGTSLGAPVRTVPLDLASLTSVSAAVAQLRDLMFSYELQRRLVPAGAPAIAVAAHPGNARTDFSRDMSAFARLVMSPRVRLLTSWLPQSPQAGALPVARAATDSACAAASTTVPAARTSGPATRSGSSPFPAPTTPPAGCGTYPSSSPPSPTASARRVAHRADARQVGLNNSGRRTNSIAKEADRHGHRVARAGR
jgi:hypothetical protein